MDPSSKQDLIELLFLALYQDDHLSMAEDGVLGKALRNLGWSEDDDGGISVGRAFDAVRKTDSDSLETEKFLQERVARLRSARHAPVAVEWLGRILGSDGLSGSEGRFLDRVRKLLLE